jgi:hypothetical protein
MTLERFKPLASPTKSRVEAESCVVSGASSFDCLIQTFLRAQLAQMTLDGLDIADLLDHLDHIKGDPDRKAQAIVAVRAKLGLPVVPGPVCRPRPLR